MHISIVAMNRIAETQAEKDPSYREGLKRHGKTLLSDARKLSDAELLGKLPEPRQHLSRAYGQLPGRPSTRKPGRNEPCPCGSGKNSSTAAALEPDGQVLG